MSPENAHKLIRIYMAGLILGIKYILLHEWEGSTGEYSVQGWQYWPDRREGQYSS